MSSFSPNPVPSAESSPATASAAVLLASHRHSSGYRGGDGGDAGSEVDGSSQSHQQRLQQHPQQQRQLQGSRSATSLSPTDRKRRWTNPAEDWLRRSATSQPESESVAVPQGNRSTDNNDNGREGVQGASSSSSGWPSLARQNPILSGGSYSTPINLSSSPPHRPRRVSSHRLDIGFLVHPERQDGNNFGYFLPRWQADSEVSHCPICETPFGFWFRKHHCRKCGRVVCSSCSPHRITIPRQFIVRPPDLSRRSSTISGPTVPVAASAARFANFTLDGRSEMSPTRINPALGGGEEVRLCNPCVPDPNPEPPRGFTAVRTTNEPGGYVVQPRQSQTRPYDSMSVASRQRPFEGASSSSPLSRSWFRTSGGSANPEPPSRFSSHAWRTGRQRPAVDERDLCPICSRPFATVIDDGNSGNEETREAHVRDCIDRHGASTHGGGGDASLHSSQPQPQPIRMVAFTATEKDCISHDGAIPECTICMEEYEVGQPLVRLECLCKFHQLCIVEWFDRKKECPVHKAN